MIFVTLYGIRDGSKLIGYPGRDHIDRGQRLFSKNKIGGGDFFFRKKGGGYFFSKKLGRRRLYFEKKLGGEEFFTAKFENPRFHFSKKANFEDQSNLCRVK